MGVSVDPSTDELYLVTEFVDGGNLAELIDDHSIKLTWRRVVSYAKDIAAAMTYLHAQNVIHRDLKAANLLIETSADRIKVCDFGLSRRQDMSGLAHMTLCGTDDYMAPEVIMGEEYNEKADVFSYGIVMYELVTRLPPAERHAKDQFRFDTDEFHQSCPPSAPPLLAQVVVDACNSEPDLRLRFTDILEMLDLVRQDAACNDEPILLAFQQDAAVAASAPESDIRSTKVESPVRQSRFATRSRRSVVDESEGSAGASMGSHRAGPQADKGDKQEEAMDELAMLLNDDMGQLTLRLLGKNRKKKISPEVFESSSEESGDGEDADDADGQGASDGDGDDKDVDTADQAAAAAPDDDNTATDQADDDNAKVSKPKSSGKTAKDEDKSDSPAGTPSSKRQKKTKSRRPKKKRTKKRRSKAPTAGTVKAAGPASELLWEALSNTDASEQVTFEAVSKVLDSLLSANGDGASEIVATAVRTPQTDDENGLTLLHAAAAQKFPTVVALLRDAGAKCKAQLAPHRFYPIHTACEAGSPEVVRELLVSSLGRGTLELTNMASETPIMVAMRHAHWETASLLLEEGCSVNTYDAAGRSPMWHIARRGKGTREARELAQQVLDGGGASDRADNEGKTPLFYAITQCDEFVANLLCEYGADLNRYSRYMFSKSDRVREFHDKLVQDWKVHNPGRVKQTLRLGRQRSFLPDNESSKCLNCKADFSPLRRRHHCRVCGNIFCDDCTKKRLPVPALGYDTPVRVCKPCVGVLKQVREEERRAEKKDRKKAKKGK
jgi:serine/threonine protein kinase/ankyrin repeat protein